MRRLEENRSIRLEKLKLLREKDVLAYPTVSKRSLTIAQTNEKFTTLVKSHKTVALAGRARSIRKHGGSIFLDLEDGTGNFQVFLSRAEVGNELFSNFVELIDPSDFLDFTGQLFRTKQGQPTLRAKSYTLLAKALSAIPEEHYGLKDVETRLRKRYLDLALNKETRALFVKKSIFWKAARDFMLRQGFLEVETPVLELVPGGAETEPFVTHYNALNQDLFLRTSLELPLKRLLVGGLEKVFEIGRIFRNEGISPEHLQDYTQMEYYWAFADYRMLMKFTQELFRDIIKKTVGSLRVKNRVALVDWGKSWHIYDYFTEFKKLTGLDLNQISADKLRSYCNKNGIAYEKYNGRGQLIDLIYKKKVRDHLIEPGFLIDPPVEIEPLAKRCPNNPDKVQRFQVMAWGTELGKGFSELNDPIDQRQRFEEQMKLREAGDPNAQRLDEDYLEAMEYGLPPAAGFGMSERFFALLMDKPVRETVLFPAMKRLNNRTDYEPS